MSLHLSSSVAGSVIATHIGHCIEVQWGTVAQSDNGPIASTLMLSGIFVSLNFCIDVCSGRISLNSSIPCQDHLL